MEVGRFVEIARIGAEKYATEQLELLKKFSEIDHGTGYIEGNKKIITLMTEVISQLKNVSIKYIENESKCRHILAGIEQPDSKAALVINSHIDTVFKPGDTEKHPFQIRGDELYGLGVADCMGGFVVSLYAVKIMQEAGLLPDMDIVMFFNCDEEIGSPSSKDIMKELAERADMAFVFEGAREENGILTSRKGVAEGLIQVEGKESHAGLKYEEGSSATVELAHQIIALDSMSDRKKGLFYNVGIISGGSGTGVVAGHASAKIAASPSNMTDFDKICSDMKKLENCVSIDGCVVKADMELVFPPMERTEKNIALYRLARKCGEMAGVTLPEQSSGGASDACHFSSFGIPTIDGLGPYLHDIHTFDERLTISSIREKTQLFATILGYIKEHGFHYLSI